ncbi:hypothetical protein COO60DRAFT_1560781 [Scenedesmus sp. NREL 46B-D3]|nr:hypothetical protein COO60DRAFT_1560781 [Scenedesmus sp. NREL 46B-D3]
MAVMLWRMGNMMMMMRICLSCDLLQVQLLSCCCCKSDNQRHGMAQRTYIRAVSRCLTTDAWMPGAPEGCPVQ